MTADPKISKPSRAEIESAVGGNLRHNSLRNNSRSAVNPTSPALQLDTLNNRRQQVIGGDLTGISHRSGGSGWLQQLRRVNFVNVIAVGIVIAILGVFFWPSGNKNVVREISTDTKPKTSGYQGVERTDDPELTGTNNDAFSHDDDLDRATEFRLEDTQHRQIELLLSAAIQHVNAGEYSRPPGNNAVSRYRQILQIDSSNRQAIEGLEFILGRFLENGYAALQSGDETSAALSLKKIQDIDADSESAGELESAITEWQRSKQITELLAQAREAWAANQLILPARENALYFYQQVAELDPDNPDAEQGITSIADEFINKANAAIMAGELPAATGYLATVSVIDSKHPSIPLLESMIATAKPIAARIQQGNSSNSRTPGINRTATDRATISTLPKRPARVSNNRTPTEVARERETFDRQYLVRGLEAYYRGEYQRAAGLLQPLADKGVARAQFRIGYMHYLGRGFDRDRKTADQIIRAALPAVQKFANEGRGWAQSDVGSLYEDGLVLPRDYAEAIYWYRSAAEQGYPGAQTNLGVMYARGRGVAANRKIAIEWFQRAAKQGDIAAIRNLESMGIQP